jgi:hypothetical protein
MLQPQSDEEIRPIVEALKQMDERLDVRWNAKAVLTQPGSYSALGKHTPPEYDGRWEIILHNAESKLHDDRDYAVLCTICEPSREGGMLHLVHGGPYAPIGEWVIELMRSADAQNSEQYRKLRDKLWAQHDAVDAAHDEIDEGAVRAAIDHQAFQQNYAGGVGRFHGRGADFGASGRIIVP